MKAANIDVIKVLLDNNANINMRDGSGNTLLHTIEDAGALSELIKYNVDVNVKNDRGESPLIYSIRKYSGSYGDYGYSNPEKVKLLLEQGANANEKEKDGTTLLHMACSKGLPDIVKLLIQYGANVEAKDNKGYAPIHYASTAVRLPGARYVPEATTEGKSSAIKILGENKANINAKTNNGETPLLILFTEDFMYNSDNSEILKTLISLGADVNAQDKRGNTALHALMYLISERWGDDFHTSDIKLLLDHGANPAIKNRAGNTVIDIIEKKFNFKEKEEIKRSDIYWEMKDRMHAPITKPKAKEPLAKSATTKQDGKKSSEKVKAAQQKAKEQNKKVDITRKEAEESVKKAKAAQQEAKESLKKLREQNQKFKESLKKTKESAKKRNEVEQELQQLEELFKATDALS